MSYTDSIVFYNHCNNGDIHLSRSMVDYLVKRLRPSIAGYSHRNPPNLLEDLDYMRYMSDEINYLDQNDGYTESEHGYFINTWVGAKNREFMSNGCDIQSIYKLFNYYHDALVGRMLDFPSLEELLPSIDFSKLAKRQIIFDFFKDRNGHKRIFISNGYVRSGQAINFNMNGMIAKLSALHDDYDFFVTNKEEPLVKADNVFYTEDIMETTDQCDLNENAYFSTFCDSIIGRSSGAFSFALNKDNFYRDVKFYSLFSEADFNGFDKIEGFKSQFIKIGTKEHLDEDICNGRLEL